MMTAVMQLSELDYALGGAMVLDGFTAPPVLNMVNATVEEA